MEPSKQGSLSRQVFSKAKKQATQRSKVFYRYFGEFVTAVQQESTLGEYAKKILHFNINPALLFYAMRSCNLDIVRYIDFHQEGTDHPISSEKLAAFHVKWLNKIQPIQWLSRIDISKTTIPDKQQRREAFQIGITINQRFCILVAEAFLDTKFSKETYDALLYALRYRPLDESGLIVLFTQSVNESAQQQPYKNQTYPIVTSPNAPSPNTPSLHLRAKQHHGIWCIGF